MREINFSDIDRKKIQRLRYHHPDPRTLRRCEILTLRMNGEKLKRIAELAGCSRSTVGRVLKAFAQKGLDETLRFHEAGPENELLAHRQSLEVELTKNPPQTIAQAQDLIEELTGIRRGPTQTRMFMRETLNFRWRKARTIAVPPKKTVQEHVATQRQFLEQELNPGLDEARQGKRAVFFVDASHMVLGAFLGCVWSLLWKFVKKQALSNHHHTNFEDFQRRIDSCLDQIPSTHRVALSKLLTTEFQTYEDAVVLAS